MKKVKSKTARKPASEKKRDAAYALVKADMLKHQEKRRAEIAVEEAARHPAEDTLFKASLDLSTVHSVLDAIKSVTQSIDIADTENETTAIEALVEKGLRELHEAEAKVCKARATLSQKAETAKGVAS